MDKSNELEGKKYLVTGASSGLGRDVATKLSNCGATVVITGRNENELKKTFTQMSGENHIVVPFNLADEDDFKYLFDEAIQDGVKLDGFVHCAGVIPLTPVATLKRDKINQCFSVNLYALIELVRIFTKSKYRNNSASVVEISSISSMYPGNCQTLYASSKAAANAAVQSLAIELFDKNIRINSLLPGIIDTPSTQEAIERIGKEIHDKTLETQLQGMIPMDRVTSAVIFLLSEKSAAITGRTIYCDGGYINF